MENYQEYINENYVVSYKDIDSNNVQMRDIDLNTLHFETVPGIPGLGEVFVVGYRVNKDGDKVYLRNITNGGGVMADGRPFLACASFIPDEVWFENHPNEKIEK